MFKIIKPYSTFKKKLNRLPRPLYEYIIGVNIGVFALWHLPFVSRKVLF